MMKLLAMVGVFLVLAAPAEAAPDPQLARELAEMKKRLDTIEKLLAEQAEAERRRSLLIEQMLRGLAGAPAAQPAPVEPKPAPSLPEPAVEESPAPPEEPAADRRFGTVAGTVRAKGKRQDAYVFLDELNMPPVKDKVARIDQVDRQFVPGLLVVQKGTRVDFPNRDAIYHNVFSLSPGQRFDLGYSRRGDIASGHRFMTPGMIEIFCNMHSNMSALLIVAPNDRFRRVGGDGSFSLGRIPVGTRKLVLIAADGQRVEQTVTVTADAVASVTFELEPPQPRRQHLNKKNQPYPYGQ